MTKIENGIEFPCLTVEQPIGLFYVGVLSAPVLTRIAFADVRRIGDPSFLKFIGFQRELNQSRVRELRQYVQTLDATFPTSILLSVSSEDAEYDEDKGTMMIRDGEDVATIIDGQHRIEGLEGQDDFDTIVAIFVDIPEHEMATIFATINLKQTRVNKSLAYELYDFAELRSPQKTGHDIAVFLNEHEDSPLKGRIKRLGVATEGAEYETVAQALIVEGVMDLITRDPIGDRDSYMRGKVPPAPSSDELQRCPFRAFFVEDRDEVIARNALNVFSAAAAVWPRAWDRPRRGHVLNRTTGVHAILRFMGETYRRLGRGTGAISKRRYEELFRSLPADADDFTTEKYPTGGAGRRALYEFFLRSLE